MKNSLPVPVQKYLNKYSLPDWDIKTGTFIKYDNIVVIPAISEYENIKTLLGSLIKLIPDYLPSTLFLFVINNKKEISQEIKEDNKQSLILLNKIINKKNDTTDKLITDIINSGLNIGYIDASSQGRELPEKTAGVGLARKVGMDCALKLFNYQNKSKNILICLDADCTVKINYISEIVNAFNNEGAKAAVLRYEHDINGNHITTKAIICYEIFLRYYHLGLLYAGSPYAFPTIGSAMACDAESYILIEGMNKRKAAEDFYFLEKLAKNVKINQINKTVVYPAGRESWRVPFGTGQRVGRYLSEKKDEYVLLNPLSFDILKQWLNLFYYGNDFNFIFNNSEKISAPLFKFLKEQNFLKTMERIKNNSTSDGQIYNQKVKWFDGFRTLKLIHHLRDNGYPEVNMFDALDEMFNKLDINFNTKRKKGSIPSIELQKKYLSEMRKFLYGSTT